MLKTILITGANGGLGKESARQLAMQSGIEKIYLACRNQDKAQIVKAELEQLTGKSIFEILLLDVENLDSVRAAVAALNEPVEALLMNAGGAGGHDFNQQTKDGVMQQFAVNVLGHVVLTEELLNANKLTKVALYAGSEAARGVKEMGMKAPQFDRYSIDEFASVVDGSSFGNNKDPQVPYGAVKYMGTLWMSAIARQYPNIRFVTMSPGGTKGTNALDSLTLGKKVMFKMMFSVMSLLGKVHKVEVGAKRFVDGLLDDSYQSGVFYASQAGITGSIAEQAKLFSGFNDIGVQENANQAIHKFIQH
jgi:NAD(P)-dependent dehydrogenase (short-subunit alcohol dehydrogenase family)